MVDMRDMLVLHCHEVLEKRPSCLPAMSAIAYLTLTDLVKGTIYMYMYIHVLHVYVYYMYCTCTMYMYILTHNMSSLI